MNKTHIVLAKPCRVRRWNQVTSDVWAWFFHCFTQPCHNK